MGELGDGEPQTGNESNSGCGAGVGVRGFLGGDTGTFPAQSQVPGLSVWPLQARLGSLVLAPDSEQLGALRPTSSRSVKAEGLVLLFLNNKPVQTTLGINCLEL